jgi:hypothetical protein
VVHVDATHLITNLTAVLPDCVMLEQQCGSAALAADLLLLTTTSHALYGERQQQCMDLIAVPSRFSSINSGGNSCTRQSSSSSRCLFLCPGSCGSCALPKQTCCLLHLPAVAFALLQKSVFVRRYNYYSLVTVGFSGVVFGLKVGAQASTCSQQTWRCASELDGQGRGTFRCCRCLFDAAAA